MTENKRESNSRKHHYVPQFLLRNFADATKMINVFDKKKREKRRQAPREIAHENDLYVLTDKSGNTANMEGIAALLDDWGSAAIRKLLETEAISALDKNERLHLSYFVGSMIVRIPHTRKQLLATNRHMISRWGPDIVAEGTDDRLGDYSEIDARNATIQMMAKDSPDFARRLRDKVWFLMRAPQGHSYYISDNPVTRHNDLSNPTRGTLGLDNRGIQVYLPLSPQITLMMLCPDMAEIAARVPETGIRRAFYTDTPVLQKPEHVEHLNSCQVIDSDRFIFSGTSDFTLAEEMISAHPNLSDGTGIQYFR